MLAFLKSCHKYCSHILGLIQNLLTQLTMVNDQQRIHLLIRCHDLQFLTYQNEILLCVSKQRHVLNETVLEPSRAYPVGQRKDGRRVTIDLERVGFL